MNGYCVGAPIRTSPSNYHIHKNVDLPDVVLDGSGILLAPFLRDLLTYEREDVKEALGIFTTTLIIL